MMSPGRGMFTPAAICYSPYVGGTNDTGWVPSEMECLGDIFLAFLTSVTTAFGSLAFLCFARGCCRRGNSASAGNADAAPSAGSGTGVSVDNSCFGERTKKRKGWTQKIAASEICSEPEDFPVRPTSPGWGRFHTWRCLLTSCLAVVHLSEVAEAQFGGSLVFLAAPLASLIALVLITAVRLSVKFRLCPSHVVWFLIFFWEIFGAVGRAPRALGGPSGTDAKFRSRVAALATLFYSMHMLTDIVDLCSKSLK
ncbi:hypothetical protein J437_LFUL011613 [Ladona fulva]|uniref:Uncharacterized protein n=1 Tax=Ladona fulva TaxID=123851 RepID=A0A8K0KBS5_LADFU|nr:hypothetical protein J437_LFUL011613 [Ladona fulva]